MCSSADSAFASTELRSSAPFGPDPPPKSDLGGKIVPEPVQTGLSAEQGGEDRQVSEQDVAGSLAAWRHPEERVELLVSRVRERVRSGQVDGLSRQDVDR